jgi:choline dehydrogenase
MPADLVADYVIVGSGAGGGPLAARLAEAGFQVLLLEAGGDPLVAAGQPENYNYSVPALHGQATEDEDLRWDYFVRHYADDAQQAKDSKIVQTPDGFRVLYPRAGTLGGCTAHNAMITVYPHNSDWDHLANLLGDPSWRPDRMREYFQRLERCQYVPEPLVPGFDPARHGFSGWLGTDQPDPKLAVGDPQLLKVIASAAVETLLESLLSAPGGPLDVLHRLLPDPLALALALAAHPHDPLAALREVLVQSFDPNDYSVALGRREGVFTVPLATSAGRRNGTREFLRSIQQRFPDGLRVATHALATRVLFQDGDAGNTAIGVEFLQGPHLYRADPRAAAGSAEPARALARREVILCAGAFNTPQLLMLSGLGPRDQLERLGIGVRRDLPGVGRNLQDRYEVGVVSEMRSDFSLVQGCGFRAPVPGETPDPCLMQWLQSKTGVYTTNGAVLGIVKRSQPDRLDPDLFLFGLPGFFKGYFPKYADQIETVSNRFTWAILKAHTNNTAGTVTLRTADARDVPDINFHYFQEGTDAAGADLDAVLAGVKFVRRLMSQPALAGWVTRTWLLPAADVEDDDQIREFIRNEAWGHHACGTCKIGTDDDPLAVLDGRFRVRGTQDLRVVDASVFPRIPGFFIVTPIYMIGEKASDVVAEDARSRQPKPF